MSPSRLIVAIVSFFGIGLFFAEYLIPFRAGGGGLVSIPFDLPGYHFPLASYAFQSLKEGRFPLWDPTMYAGMPFIANVQAALFYPGTWLMFAANWWRDHLHYLTLEHFTIAHVWLAFFLCYLWLSGLKGLRGLKLDPLACLLGSSVYALSGYLCTQLQHFGLVAAYAWFPLALWGIDQAVQQQRWRPLWKVVAASALGFLAGYPPTWMVFAMIVVVYALAQRSNPLGRFPLTGAVILALIVSLGIAAIQILPAMQISEFREPEWRYGSGVDDWRYFLPYFIPNYFNFGLDQPLDTAPRMEYLYLGAPGILGLALLFRRRYAGSPSVIPGIAVIVASLIMVINPWGAVWAVIQHSDLLADVLRSTYFLAGITVGAAMLSAIGLDAYLKRSPRPHARNWMRRTRYTAVIAMGLWALAELFRWPNDFADVGTSGIDAALSLAVLGLGLYAYRLHARDAQRPALAIWLALSVLTSVAVDYKVFGTSKRFDASTGPFPSADLVAGFNPESFRVLHADPSWRVLLDDTAPPPADLRHTGLAAPQGFDPFLSIPYREFASQYAEYNGDRNFWFDPVAHDAEALRLLGVRYIITSEGGRAYSELAADPRFTVVGKPDSYYRVFEYQDAVPPYGWLARDTSDHVEVLDWSPERRSFRVSTSRGGRLTLSEQWFPGWEVEFDREGRRIASDRWKDVFQSVQVPAGEHVVTFTYRSTLLWPGAAISAISLLVLGWWMWRMRADG